MPILHPAPQCSPEQGPGRHDANRLEPPQRRAPRRRRCHAIEFSPVGQNLLHSRRRQPVPQPLPLTATQVGRAAYGKLTLRF
jgi:hypothetical protein